jgi:multicomponent Na+:H+ antiporter subunit E
MRRFVLAAIATAGVYLAILGSTDPLDVATGLVIAAAILLVARRGIFDPDPPELPPFLGRVVAFPAWVIVTARDVVRGVLQVARASVNRRNLPPAGVVEIPIGDRTTPGIGVSALTATLSPGEVLVDVDLERGVMYLHVLDATDPDAVRAAHAQVYERYQRRVIP